MKYLLSLMLVTAMTCQTIKTPRNFVRMYRCENDEVICYYYEHFYKGGMSCKFKEQEQ